MCCTIDFDDAPLADLPVEYPRRPGRILTRRPGELIVAALPPDLGGVILRVSCVSVHDRQVRIGIDCPRAWSLYTGELVGERLRFPSRPRMTQLRGPSRAAPPR